ncbi:MAG TPA: hypothetical protein VNL15_06215 [Dehalococcoidia bacterium]|nr:hypothetical protein [Dehalococcoidia bacterium]
MSLIKCTCGRLDCRIAYPESLTNEELAAAAGYAQGGAFNNPKGRLRTLGLITYPTPGMVRAADLLFPEGYKALEVND